MLNASFFINSALLGVGLAMDAFSATIANSLSESKLKKSKAVLMSGVFAFFQFLMPLIGWILVRSALGIFTAVKPFIPYIALILLTFIGGKAIYESLKKKNSNESAPKVIGFGKILVQGIATSIDALSVGLTTEGYTFVPALISSLIIAAVTFIICLFGSFLGKKFGKIFTKAEIIGGVILIAIGIEIFIKAKI